MRTLVSISRRMRVRGGCQVIDVIHGPRVFDAAQQVLDGP